MRKLSLVLAAAATLAWSLPMNAEHMAVVTSDDARRNSDLVNKNIKWNDSLEVARDQARKEGKLVLWVHMLGTMDGAT